MKKNILVKISGDLVNNRKALKFIQELTKKYYVVVIVGGGTQISKRLKKAGYETKFKNGIRIHPDLRSRKIARDVLEEIEAKVQDKLIGALVITPYLYIGRVLCHINGDELFDILAPSFDKAFCLTLKNRKKFFRHYNYITIKEY